MKTTTTKRFTDEESTTWTVRIVYEGDRFGLDDCLTHDSSDPLIEFYDHEDFVSRYYASTLLEDRRYGLSFDERRGVDVETLRQITAWIAPLLGA